jgi:chloramphenicol 3-O phosphotransferase
VRCSLSVVNAREAKRPGRFPGTATSHFDRVHVGCVYDVEVDTSQSSPLDCARRIISHVDSGARPIAFETLRAKAR